MIHQTNIDNPIDFPKYTLTTAEEFAEYDKQFQLWHKENKSLFNDCRGICRSAIMEFLANKDHKTVFMHKGVK